MANLTAIVLTKNERENLPACLKSIEGFAKRVVVVDSGSDDGTQQLAEELGADVYTHAFTYYAAQFNWAIEHTDIDTDWILRLDADERMTKEACAECEQLLSRHAADDVNGVVLEADFYFLGKCIRHGSAKKRKILLFRRGCGSIEDRKRDAHTILTGGRYVRAKNRFLHYDFKDLTSYIARYNWYTIRELSDYLAYRDGAATEEVNTDARLMRTRKNKFGVYYRAPMFLRAWLWFVYNYYFRLGFLDGREGYLYNYFECYWYRFLVDAKIYEHDKTGRAAEELRALNR